jgi:hypothetical protein
MNWVPIKDSYTIDLYRFAINAAAEPRVVTTLRGTLKPFPHGSGQNVTVQPISLENGLAHMASLPSVRAKVLGSSTLRKNG